jgi:hypothetical protein
MGDKKSGNLVNVEMRMVNEENRLKGEENRLRVEWNEFEVNIQLEPILRLLDYI